MGHIARSQHERAGFAALVGCQEVRTIDLTACPVTDETVVQIPRFTNLSHMCLAGTQITNKGALHFLDWASLDGFGGPQQISGEVLPEFKRRFRARVAAAGERPK